jgi:hypothetical protein
MLNKNQRLFKYLLERITNWWSSYKSKPPTPLTEKVNGFFIGLLALVSTTLAFLTFNQQQEIKGMSNLLRDQGILINYTISLYAQNKLMITKLDTSQIYLLKQLNAINNQTKSNQYSTKPLIGLADNLQIQKLEKKDYYRIFIVLKNNGNRSATKFNMKAYWAIISKNQVTKKIIYNNFSPDAEIQPNQTVNFITEPIPLSEIQRKEFESYYLIMRFDYIDPLTHKSEKADFVGSPLRLSDEYIFYYMVTGKNLESLKTYLPK